MKRLFEAKLVLENAGPYSARYSELDDLAVFSRAQVYINRTALQSPPKRLRVVVFEDEEGGE